MLALAPRPIATTTPDIATPHDLQDCLDIIGCFPPPQVAAAPGAWTHRRGRVAARRLIAPRCHGKLTGRGRIGDPYLRELMRTNDPVLLSFVEALLRDSGLNHMVLDANMSVLEGSLGILPRRVLVEDEGYNQAVRIMGEAGLAAELRPSDERK